MIRTGEDMIKKVEDGGGGYSWHYCSLPRKDILGMIIPQVNLGSSTNGDALSFEFQSLKEIRL